MKNHLMCLLNQTFGLQEALSAQLHALLTENGYTDINPIQALIIFNLGQRSLRVGDLGNFNYYHGTNVSYNLKKLVNENYVIQRQSPQDGRISFVTNAPKALSLCDLITDKFTLQHLPLQRHIESFKEALATIPFEESGQLPALKKPGWF